MSLPSVSQNVTHSRNQDDTGGHQRTGRRAESSTGGHWRKRRDTGGHEIRRVRDREAPGSNPGPPTIFVFEFERFPMLIGVSFTPPYHSRQTQSDRSSESRAVWACRRSGRIENF